MQDRLIAEKLLPETVLAKLPNLDDPNGFAAHLRRFSIWQLERNYSRHTVDTRARILRDFIVWADHRGLKHPQEITKPVVERFQRHLFYYRKANGAPLSFRTQSMRMTPIRAFFKWLTKQNIILSNPSSDIDLPRPEMRLPNAILTIDEAEKILAQPNIETPAGLRDRAMMELLYVTGMRRSEAAQIKNWDMDFGRKAAIIRQGKGHKDRVVPIGERALKWLEKYRDEARPKLSGGDDNHAFFLNRWGQQLEEKRLTKMMHEYKAMAGVKKPGACHLWRHTMATMMLEGGADIRFIQSMLGHATLETTQIYTRVSITKLAEIQAATHPAARLKPNDGQNTDATRTTLLAVLDAEGAQEADDI